ncbi:MAG: alpha/beta hydrolase [Actinobacteria bacterium]|nr:alpha/beta hydrolase [Actinomycetota bacterium]
MDHVELTESFDWKGGSVRWRRFGSGPPVVLCHGTPWSSFVWRSVIENLSTHRSVYAWDMIGYGQSDKVDGDVSLASQGELLAALVCYWGLDAPDVVAHDYGGTVCLRAHLLHEMAVASFTLIDVVALRPWGSPFFQLVAGHADVFAALPANLHEALLREYISGASGPGLLPDVLDCLVAPWLGDGQAAFYRQIAQADERFTAEVEAHYGDIDVPTLIVWGTADQWIPIDRAHRLKSLIAGSSIEIIDGAGHLVQEDRPAELKAIIDQWLPVGSIR